MSTIDLCIGLECLTSRTTYTRKAGLQHYAICSRISVDAMEDVIPRRPKWGKMDNQSLEKAIMRVAAKEDGDMWPTLREEVNNLPRVGRRKYDTAFWNPDLQRTSSDLHVARRRRYGKDDGNCYRLIPRVYRAMLLKAGRDHIVDTISKSGDPGIFKHARELNAQRTLLTMMHNGCPVSSHKDLSELIAQQLCPGNAEFGEPEVIDMGDVVEIGMAIRQSPMNTAPGFDDIGYPFIQFWAKTESVFLERLIKYGLDQDIADWHVAHMVLIEKAGKPRYDTVKSWQMIYLLPTLTKVVERIILIRLTKCVELGDTQFGSRRKRGVHDPMATILEFIKHH